jgi:CspA family cold shock protein
MTTLTEKPERHIGTVKFFSEQLGYGFIQTPMDSPIRQDIFVHHTSIVMDGYRTLEKDQQVEFEVGQEEKGPIARKVVVI